MAVSTETASSLLFLLLLGSVYGEDPEPTFRSDGSVIELGYCFGVDYILVYRTGPQGDQLLGNSSANATLPPLPADVQGRVSITNYQHLLGLQIAHLRRSDSGVYRRECWQDRALANQHQHRLYVCDEEVVSVEIALAADGGAELLCNSTSVGLEGATVRWYYEVFPSYKATLFLDTAVSPRPLAEELRGKVEVRDGGASLRVPGSMLTNSQQFHCQVMHGQSCLGFQNLYLPDRTDVRDVFASEGERVALDCLSDQEEQRWDTPLGSINTSAKVLMVSGGAAGNDHMHLSDDDGSGSYLLIIPLVSDRLSGEYSCFSPTLMASYSLGVCPRQEPKEKYFPEGGDVLLECEVSSEESLRVQWHRRSASVANTLIVDCKDKSVPIPEDLRGRVTLHEHCSSLGLTGLAAEDAGAYWCVVLGGPVFLEHDEDYQDEEVEEYDDEDDYGDWSDTYRCVSKQVTVLSVAPIGHPVPGDLDTNPPGVVTPGQDGRMLPGLETEPTAEPSDNTMAYALGAALVGLAVAAVIAAVIAVKMKKRKAAKGSGLKASKETEMKEDPGCTERLNPTEEYHA